MNLPLLSVHRTVHGATEKVVLEITEDTNLAHYLLTDNTEVSEGALAELHCFYFPHLPVRQGDRVHVVTGSGKDMVLENEAGNKTYVFFCHRDQCRWREGITPVLQLRQARSAVTIMPVTPATEYFR